MYAAILQSNQVGSSATNGYVLQTNGATSTWVATSTLGITGGTSNPSVGSQGFVQFASSVSGQFDGTSTLFWDRTNNRLGLGTSSPTHTLTIASSSRATTTNALAWYNTLDQTGNFERVVSGWSANQFNGYIITASGTGTTNRQVNIASAGGGSLRIDSSGLLIYGRAGTSVGPINTIITNDSYTGTAVQVMASIKPTFNQATTSGGGYTTLQIQPTETLLGTSSKLLIQAGTSTNANLFVVDNIGRTGIGTGTPLTNLQVTTPATNATTTLTVGKAGQTKGSCLELFDASGVPVYLWITPTVLTLNISATSCK